MGLCTDCQMFRHHSLLMYFHIRLNSYYIQLSTELEMQELR